MPLEVAMQRSLSGSLDPGDVCLRPFCEGEGPLWVEIQDSTGMYRSVSQHTFERDFGTSPSDREARIFFVERDRRTVATGAAWHPESGFSADWGRLHWIAVRPEFQRAGIGRGLTLALLEQLRVLGHSHAYLTTGSQNRAAIQLYRSVGFTPFLRSEEERQFWEACDPLSR